MNVGSPQSITDTQLHVFHHSEGADHENTGLLLVGLEWDAKARPGRTTRLEWRGAHTTIQPGSQSAFSGGFPAVIGSQPAIGSVPALGSQPALGSLLVQMCLAVVQEKQQCDRDAGCDPVSAGNPPENAGCGHGAGEHTAGKHTAGGLEGLWIFVARVQPVDDNDTTRTRAPTRWWLGGTQDGRPSHTVPEELHGNFGDLMRTLAAIAATSPQLAGVAVTPSSADRLIDAIEERGPELPLPVTVTPLAVEIDGPLFEEPPRHRTAKVAAATIGCTILAAGLAWYGGLFAGPSLPEQEITFAVPVAGAVRSACLDGLTGKWPRMPGWKIAAAGCGRTGYLPDDLKAPQKHDDGVSPEAPDGNDVIVWRAYEQDTKANTVLTGAAGGRLIAAHGQGPTHGHAQSRDSDKRLVLWRREHLETRQASPGGFQPLQDMERMLSQAFADVPGAVHIDGNILTVTVTDPPQHAFSRLDEAGPHVELLAVTRRGDRTILQLRPGNGEAI